MKSEVTIICFENEAFYKLLDEIYKYLDQKTRKENEWITGKDAMQLLGIKSKTTLQKLRNNGKIRFSQPFRKVVLYDRASLIKFLEENVLETF